MTLSTIPAAFDPLPASGGELRVLVEVVDRHTCHSRSRRPPKGITNQRERSAGHMALGRPPSHSCAARFHRHLRERSVQGQPAAAQSGRDGAFPPARPEQVEEGVGPNVSQGGLVGDDEFVGVPAVRGTKQGGVENISARGREKGSGPASSSFFESSERPAAPTCVSLQSHIQGVPIPRWTLRAPGAHGSPRSALQTSDTHFSSFRLGRKRLSGHCQPPA